MFADKTVSHQRQFGKLTQLLSQQSRLVVATLSQPFLVQRHRHQNLPGHGVADEIIIKPTGKEPRQSSEVSIL
jgi:hypothetical protein